MRGWPCGPARAVAVLTPLLVGLPAATSASQDETSASNGWPGGPETGAAALRGGSYGEAEAAYRAALPEPGARLGLAETLRLTGRYREALETLEPEAGASPVPAELLARAEIHLEIGEGEAAENLLRRHIERVGPASDGSSLEAETLLGLLELRRGKRQAGLARLDEVIAAYNTLPGAVFRARELAAVGKAAAALGFQSSGLFRDALRVFDEAAVLDPGDPLPPLLAAELLLDKFNTAEAAESITTVLRNNPRHPHGLFLAARLQDRQIAALAEGGPPPDALAEALAVNPHFPPARALEVQRLLEQDRREEAEQRAAAAVDALPDAPETLAALAAVRLLAGEDPGLFELEARYLHNWAGDPLLDLALASAAERRRWYQEAAQRSRAALRRSPDSAAALRLLGLNLLRLGDVGEGRKVLEDAFQRDPFDALVKNTLDLLDELDGFTRVNSPPFEFVLPAAEADVLRPYVEALSREAVDSFRDRYGYQPPETLRVEIYDRSADFSVRTVGIPGIGAHGVCFGNVIALESPSARGIGTYHWASTLWHELAHAAAMGLTDNRVPRWFTEGLSLLEERWRFGDGASLPFYTALRDGQLLDIPHLDDGFVRPTWPGQVGVSYFHASLVLEHLEREYGFAAILEMLEGYRQGMDTPQVIEGILGITPKALDEAVDALLEARFGETARGLEESGPQGQGTPLHPPPEPDRGIEALVARADAAPANFALQIRAGVALQEAGLGAEATERFERAAELAPEYGGPDGPYRYLSRLYADAGEPDLARLSLHDHLKRFPAAYDEWLRLAAIYSETGNPREAGAALTSAIEAYPMLPEPHERLAEAAAAQGLADLEVRERQAVLASGAPDRAGALYSLALAHFRAGNRDAARRRVLEALEIAPTFDPALRLLLDLRREG
ncbi:MAG: tetratricopeptide repeat protein [Acidobacteria bacterium]|nr:tetratricopeptide repeat protein [Acidobacteriota bacterium]MYH21423.1 tetratricopeptide repeat protein [Acidobacteriota bacterium]MYK78070.1 tetratricopeptide repeat protein [Acidobacteriota bacterium]